MAEEAGFNGAIEAAQHQLEMVGKAIIEAMPRGVAKGGEVLADAAASLAPRRSGVLAGSDGHEPVEESNRNIATERVFFTAFHSRFQEFGTSHHPARPFLRPAAEMKQREIEAAIAEEVSEAAEEAILQYRGVMSSR